ncbi:MAG: hypothetical protein J6Y28_08355 [Acholeplasmatales bacterium]|nr:hypothetical protein [Acholeplasmatales bacterium]
MNKITKISSSLLLLALFAGCKGKTTTKKGATTKLTPTSVTTKKATSSITTTKKSATQKTSTKDHVSNQCTLTVAGDTSGDTATLKNTVRVFNETKNATITSGNQFDSGDRLIVTLFNLATDVKIRVYSSDFDYFPWFSYEKLTGDDATTGEEIMAFSPTEDITIAYMVDDGEEAVDYVKFNSSIATTDVDVTFTVAGMDEVEHNVVDGDTVVSGSTLYYTIKNKSTTNKVIFAYYDDNQLDSDATVVIEPNSTLEDYNAIMGDIKLYVEPYTEYSVTKATLPVATAVACFDSADKTTPISFGTDIQKYTYVYPYVSNNSTTDYIAKVTINDVVVAACILSKDQDVLFDGIVLTGNMVVSVDAIEGPTITINSPDEVFLSTGYLIYSIEEEQYIEKGIGNDEIVPRGLELSIQAIYFATEYTELTITITIGDTTVYSKVIPDSEDGLFIDGIYATDNIVITIE